MVQNEWKFPLNIALAFHVLVFLSAIYLPELLDTKPRFEEIYTVSLVNMADIEAPAPQIEPTAEPTKQVKESVPESTPKPEPAPKTEPVIEKKIEAVSIPEPEQITPEPTPVAPPKAISLKASKRKIKKVLPKQESKETPKPKKTQAVDQSKLKRQKLAELIRAEQAAAEEARILAEEAAIEKRLADLARRKFERTQTTPKQQTSTGRTGAATQNRHSALEKQYYAAIFSKLHAHWSLPEYREWPETLKATIVITIAQNGLVIDKYFEKKSGDPVFDKFVEKTISDAGKMPPIPSAIKKRRIEIGLHFSPGGIE